MTPYLESIADGVDAEPWQGQLSWENLAHKNISFLIDDALPKIEVQVRKDPMVIGILGDSGQISWFVLHPETKTHLLIKVSN